MEPWLPLSGGEHRDELSAFPVAGGSMPWRSHVRRRKPEIATSKNQDLKTGHTFYTGGTIVAELSLPATTLTLLAGLQANLLLRYFYFVLRLKKEKKKSLAQRLSIKPWLDKQKYENNSWCLLLLTVPLPQKERKMVQLPETQMKLDNHRTFEKFHLISWAVWLRWDWVRAYAAASEEHPHCCQRCYWAVAAWH